MSPIASLLIAVIISLAIGTLLGWVNIKSLWGRSHPVKDSPAKASPKNSDHPVHVDPTKAPSAPPADTPAPPAPPAPPTPVVPVAPPSASPVPLPEFRLLNRDKTAAIVFADGDKGEFGASYVAPDSGDVFVTIRADEEAQKIKTAVKPTGVLYKLYKDDQALGWLKSADKFGWYTTADDLNLILLEKVSDSSYALWMTNQPSYLLSGAANPAGVKNPLFVYPPITKDGKLSPEQRAFRLVSA